MLCGAVLEVLDGDLVRERSSEIGDVGVGIVMR